MQVWALVNEADIAHVREGMPASFTVDAYPNKTFKGTVTQIRLNAQQTQNVVLYTVVITFDNKDAKLLPYMTATVRFEVETHRNVLLVPNAALRYEPIPESPERPEYPPMVFVPRGTTHDGRQNLESLHVQVGISDGEMTEISGEKVSEGMEVVVGDNRPSKPSENPFRPVDPSKRRSSTPSSPAVSDEQAIQGAWEVVDSTLRLIRKLPDGEDVSADELRKTTKVIITGEMLKIVGEHVTDLAFAYRLNPNAKTKMIDLQTGGEEYGLLSYGIYELKGDQLTICASPLAPSVYSNPTTGADEPPDARIHRPTEFWAELGSGKELLVLQRVGKAVESEDEKNIQGTWIVEKTSPENGAGGFGELGFKEKCRVEFGPDWYGSHIQAGGGQDMDYKVGYALNPNATPKQIDIANIMIPGLMPVHGIYNLKGDELTIHWAFSPTSGGELPTPGDFNSAGQSVFAVTLKRATASPPNTANAPASATNPAADLKALQGAWKVVRQENGAAADTEWDMPCPTVSVNLDVSKINRMTFDSQIMKIRNAERNRNNPWGYALDLWSYYNYQIDPAATPKTIDIVSGQDKEKLIAVGIYEFEGNTLKLCLAKYQPSLKNNQRPKDFSIDPKSGDISLVLELSPDAKAFKGTWMIADQTDNGRKTPAEELKNGFWGFGYSDVVFPNELEKDHGSIGGFLLEENQMPKQILITASESGDNNELKDVQFRGIYKIDGDRLTIAYRKNGPAPDKFESAPGSGVTLLELKRSAPQNKAPEKMRENKIDPAAPAVANPAADLETLQGQWKTIRQENGGNGDAQVLNSLNLHSISRLRFQQNTAVFVNLGDAQALITNFSDDPTSSPKTIDIHKDNDPQKGQLIALGIYEFEGDLLKICLTKYQPSFSKDDQRPKSFAIDPKLSDTLVTLERYRPSEEEKKLLGHWAFANYVKNGDPAPDEQLIGKTCEFKDCFFSIHEENRGGYIAHWGPFFLDESKEPKQITFYAQMSDYAYAHTQIHGIYKIEGDRLTIAFHKDGQLPEKFESIPDSGISLLELKRGDARPVTDATAKPDDSKAKNESSEPPNTPDATSKPRR